MIWQDQYLEIILLLKKVNKSARTVPFRMFFKTDANEANTGGTTVAAADATTNELAFMRSGTIGFSLKYVQSSC